ncbi:mannan-binding lectin [Luedemannella flava]
MSVVEIEYDSPAAGTTEYTLDVLAGPVLTEEDARAKCPAICASYGGSWTGQWRIVVPNRMSVANCRFRF